jgi:hypothetical protein
MALIETDRLRPKNAEKDVALRDWVRALEARANRFARWALDQGLAKDDTVA